MSDPKTCGTCKYFGRVVEYWDEEANDIMPGKYHACDLIKHMNGHPSEYGGPAGVTDGSGYRATFCVSEEFGCNQWAAGADTSLTNS